MPPPHPLATPLVELCVTVVEFRNGFVFGPPCILTSMQMGHRVTTRGRGLHWQVILTIVTICNISYFHELISSFDR